MVNLADIITSKVRIKILELFFSNLKEVYHVRGIVRETSEEINAVRRELTKMEKDGLLTKEPRGNRIYYSIRPEYPLFGDLVSMVAKTTGLGKVIIENKNKIGRVSFVMFSGKFVQHLDRKRDDDVDILVVGEVVLPELASIIRTEETTRDAEINYTAMTEEEFAFRKKNNDPFIWRFLKQPKVMLVGQEEDIVK